MPVPLDPEIEEALGALQIDRKDPTIIVTKEFVTKQFKKLSLTHHPDKGGTPQAFREINDAKDILLDAINKGIKFGINPLESDHQMSENMFFGAKGRTPIDQKNIGPVFEFAEAFTNELFKTSKDIDPLLMKQIVSFVLRDSTKEKLTKDAYVIFSEYSEKYVKLVEQALKESQNNVKLQRSFEDARRDLVRNPLSRETGDGTDAYQFLVNFFEELPALKQKAREAHEAVNIRSQIYNFLRAVESEERLQPNKTSNVSEGETAKENLHHFIQEMKERIEKIPPKKEDIQRTKDQVEKLLRRVAIESQEEHIKNRSHGLVSKIKGFAGLNSFRESETAKMANTMLKQHGFSVVDLRDLERDKTQFNKSRKDKADKNVRFVRPTQSTQQPDPTTEKELPSKSNITPSKNYGNVD